MSHNKNPFPQDMYNYMLRFCPDGTGHHFDLHHCLVDKGDVMGMPLEERKKIHDPRNLWWVPKQDHASHANILTKQEYYAMLCNRFSQVAIDAFLNSINWKTESNKITPESLKG